MTLPVLSSDLPLDERWLDAPRLCRLAGVSEDWLLERVQLGLLRAPALAAREDGRFDAADLRRVRRMALLEQHFDAVPELAALVADLEDELAELRARRR